MPSKNSLNKLKAVSNDNSSNPILGRDLSVAKTAAEPKKVERVNKGFQVEKGRVRKWDLLVAQLKGAEEKKTGPELIDEALDYLFEKYELNDNS